MNTLLDVHTHTIVSGHAFSTLAEMVAEAQRKGLSVLGITEHGPSIPGTCDLIYFRNIHVVPRRWGSLRLLLGAEINILNTKGELDMDEPHLRRLDLRIAGIHGACWTPGTPEENTQGMIRAIRNPWVNIISHPCDGTAELIYEPIVEAAREAHTLLEINSSSMCPVRKRPAARDNYLEVLRLCKRMQVPVILGSDAHIAMDIANYEYCIPLLRETDFPEHLVVNTQPDFFFDYLGLTNKP